MSDDKSQLLSMGFAEKITKNAGLQPALDWIVANPDDDGEMKEENQDDPADEIQVETPQSLLCEDCSKLLRDAVAAEHHAIKTGHTNFVETTTAIKPLSPEEKAAKVKELEVRLEKRREEKRLMAIEEEKRKETVRRTTGAEMQIIREQLEQDQMAKQVAETKRRKEEDRIAKEQVKRALELDKLERKRQADERKGLISAETKPAPVKVQPVASGDYTETRIQIRLPNGPPITKSFAITDSLSTVYEFVSQTHQGEFKLLQSFPRKAFDQAQMSKTLKELGLVPSAALIVQ